MGRLAKALRDCFGVDDGGRISMANLDYSYGIADEAMEDGIQINVSIGFEPTKKLPMVLVDTVPENFNLCSMTPPPQRVVEFN